MKEAIRLSDLGNRSRLIVTQDADGDWWIACGDETGRGAGVEFCTIGHGGGRSPLVRDAIAALFQAIETDNRERPL